MVTPETTAGESDDFLSCTDTDRSRRRRVRLLRWLLLLLGLALFGLIVVRTGVRSISSDIASQGWALVPFILASGIENALHAESSLRCIRPEHRRAISWWRMFLLYHMAYAINLVTPTGDVGGDVARGVAMSRFMPANEAASSVMINKFTFCIARMSIAGGFAGLAVAIFPMASGPAWALGTGSALTILALLLFALFQSRGWLGRALTGIARLGGRKRQEWMRTHSGELDSALTSFYTHHKGDLLSSILFDALGSAVGAAQRAVFIALLLDRSSHFPKGVLITGAAVWGITNLVDMIFFFVVGRLGVREGSYQLAFQTVGLPIGKGVALSIVDRIDQLFWTLLGLTVYWKCILEPGAAQDESLVRAERVPK